jgi:SAM-dependent methyltransferase
MLIRKTCLDSPEREAEVASLIRRKRALVALYRESYEKFMEVLSRTPDGGVVLELGSGAGFAKEVIPELITSDVLPYRNVDCVINAEQLPFSDASLRAVFLLNVFHHTRNVEALLAELQRCLKTGGRALIIDQYPGYPARWIYRYLHHEPYDANAISWKFPSSGPLSGANGALAWIVFERDRAVFNAGYPGFRIERMRAHTPFRYWLTGGLRSWCLLPAKAFRFASRIDSFLISLWPKFGSFVDIELHHVAPEN